MAFIRRKEVTLDNVKITVAPLLGRQAEQFFESQERIKKDGNSLQDYKAIWRKLIADGLNNAEHDVDGGSAWTPDRVLAEFDPVFATTLRNEIGAMSGILFNQGEVTAP